MGTQDKFDVMDRGIESFKKDVLQLIAHDTRSILKKVNYAKIKYLEEIRLRANKPLIIQDYYGDWLVDFEGHLIKKTELPFIVEQEDLIKTLELMSENSIYAFQEEIRNGFLTLKGGHRVGITGKTVLDKESIKNIKDISGLNIRISREVPGCCSNIFKYIIKNRNEVYNILIISPPQCGKTTILRDLARVVSNGSEEPLFKGIKVGIVDERSEIAACHKGVPQNDIGIRTDVLDGCPKAIGMGMMLRSMSPQVIITDEIGNEGDREAVMQVLNAGVKIITTAHGYNISELKTRREVLRLIEEKVFERFIVLSSLEGPGTLEEVVDGASMKIIYRRE